MAGVVRSALALATCAIGACSAGEGGVAGNDRAAGGSGGTGGSGPGGAGATSDAGATGAGTAGTVSLDGGPDDSGLDACVAKTEKAELVVKPIDVILLVDTSSTMQPAVDQVEANINGSFASLLAASGIDYRVIVIAQHSGGSDGICVSAPLSGTTCNPVPPAPVNTAVFYHYDPGRHLGSSTSLSEALMGYASADAHGFAPNGYRDWVRDASLKIFLAINDATSADGSIPSSTFDSQLLALVPPRFGTPGDRRYVFHSIVGLSENVPPTKPWEPADPIQNGTCSGYTGGVAPGQVYQEVSVLSGGLRFPLCQFQAFDEVFKVIATAVIEGAAVACSFEMPMAPPGETIDPTTIVVRYTASAGGETSFAQVAGESACAPASFWVDANGIHLCPEACATVQADAGAKIDLAFGCPPPPPA